MNRIRYIFNILLLFLGTFTTANAQTILGKIYGGGELAKVDGDTKVHVKSGTVGDADTRNGGVFGGGLGQVTVVTGNVNVIIGKENPENDEIGPIVNGDVYGGSALGKVNGTAPTKDYKTSVTINAGVVNGSMYGGGLGDANTAANVYGPVLVTANGGKVHHTTDGTGCIFGGNNLNGSPKMTIKVDINGTADDADAIHRVYGGGNMADYVAPEGELSPTVTISGGNVGEDAFGGGLSAKVTGSTLVQILGGTVHRNVYGGGALADVDGNTQVDLFGGSVGGAYGGALGQLADVGKQAVEAHVTGNTTVTLGKEVAGEGGSKSYTSTVVTGDGIFGCNNLNGTPQGHAFVHVLKTVPRKGDFEYHVPAVYGGGNLSAYEPTNEDDFAEVLIENCDNSIEYVYGGGNAAPVPSTQVTIYGADAINHAFAGGNGAGEGNPGADVGYLGYFSKGSATEYGTGKSSVTVYGGTVHNVYGGSNTLGYIRGGTSVNVKNAPDDYEGTFCELKVGNVYGGGNEADINCDITLNLDCSEGGEILYAGANDADVHGNITLNIVSGTFGKVFCGNNKGGNVFGSLKVNVDETGCWPVMIGELYACGNEAAYSVYGYNDDKSCKTEGEQIYDDPEINLISFTRIGKVFGGGYGKTAVLHGNTHVNVNPIKGKFAGKSPSPLFFLDGDDKRKRYNETATLPYGFTKDGSDKIIFPETGSIGSIYGGGNAGAVYGNTEVKIGMLEKNKHISGIDQTTEEEVAVTITGNVFGGGNDAIVSGDTNVTIGQ